MLPCMLCPCADDPSCITINRATDALPVTDVEFPTRLRSRVVIKQGRDTLRTLTIRQLAQVSASLAGVPSQVHVYCLVPWVFKTDC
jgi:hypothetical protein